MLRIDIILSKQHKPLWLYLKNGWCDQSEDLTQFVTTQKYLFKINSSSVKTKRLHIQLSFVV